MKIETRNNTKYLLTIVKGKLHSQKSFMFVLNLFVSNLLMSSVGIPLYIVPAFFTYPGNDVISSFLWIYCLQIVWNLFAEQYAYFSQSLHFRKYEGTFTVRNALIVLSGTWFSTSRPLTNSKARGYFKLVQRTFDITALNNQDSYRYQHSSCVFHPFHIFT